jgi:hypothetical protein
MAETPASKGGSVYESPGSPLGERPWTEVFGFRDLRKAIMWSYRSLQEIFRWMELDCFRRMRRR